MLRPSDTWEIGKFYLGFYMFVSKIHRFLLKIWEMSEKIKTDVDGLLLNLTMKTDFPIYLVKIELFIIFQIKSSPASTSLLNL